MVEDAFLCLEGNLEFNLPVAIGIAVFKSKDKLTVLDAGWTDLWSMDVQPTNASSGKETGGLTNWRTQPLVDPSGWIFDPSAPVRPVSSAG